MSTESKNQQGKPSNSGPVETTTAEAAASTAMTPEQLAEKEAALKAKEEALAEKEAALQEKELSLQETKEVVQKVAYDPNEKMFGNQDLEKKHQFPKSYENGVVVLQVETEKRGADVVTLPSTERVQVYTTHVYDHMVKNKLFAGKKIQVLHDPRKED